MLAMSTIIWIVTLRSRNKGIHDGVSARGTLFCLHSVDELLQLLLSWSITKVKLKSNRLINQ